MPKYYHAASPVKVKLTSIPPKGNYEDASKGCPEPLFGDIGAGFPISKVDETSFSKSIAGAVMGAARFCEGHCELDIFSTDEKPDVDLSDCPYDFQVLEEVRFRREVPVEHMMRLVITPELVEELGVCYSEEGIPSESMLGCVKEGVAAQVMKGNKKIAGMGERALEDCWLKQVGLSRQEWEMHERNIERTERSVPSTKLGDRILVYYPVTGNIFKAKALSEPIEIKGVWKVKIIDKAGDPAYAVWSDRGGGFVYGDVE
jgi:hypothetical protein